MKDVRGSGMTRVEVTGLTMGLSSGFKGSYTTKSDIHLVSVQKQGETQTTSQRLVESTSYRSGTYALDCVGSLSFHYANGSTQSTDYSYVCTTP